MFDLIRADVRRTMHGVPYSGLRRLILGLTLNSIHVLVLIRIQLWCAKHGLPTIFTAKVLFWFFGIEIGKNVEIGPGLRLPHPMGIIIAPNVTIGEKCDLYADVRLVLAHGAKQGPQIGNHVFLGDGAKVLGNINVGDNVIIGVSSVVTKDIPANATAVGIPAKVIKESNDRLSQQ